MRFSSIFSKEKKEVSLLLDIGNGSISLGLIALKKGELPEFLFVNTLYFEVNEEPDPEKLLQSMSIILENHFSILIKSGFSHTYWKNNKKRIDNVLVSFSSPWFVTKTKHITLSQEKPFIITREFLEDIAKKEEDIFKGELATNKSINKDIFDVVEKSIVHTKINGYILEKSIGKKTKYFDSYLYISIVGKNVLNKVHQIIHKHTHISEEKIFIHTFPLISFSVIRDIFIGNSSFIIMDITADITDITLVCNDVITKSISMQSGRNFILRQIGKVLNQSPEIAESNLRLFLSKKLNKEMQEKIETILADIEREWSIYFENALGELSKDMNLPAKIFLTSENDVSDIYTHFIKLAKTDTTALFRKNVVVTKISKDILSHFYNTTFSQKTNEFIGIMAIMCNKFFQSK